MGTPSTDPSTTPVANPSAAPSQTPTQNPTAAPFANPSAAPSQIPTQNPTAAPFATPSVSAVPTLTPSVAPSNAPTNCDNLKTSFNYTSLDGVIETIKCKKLTARKGRRINGVKYYELDKRCLNSEVVRNVCRKRCALCTPE